MKLLIITQKVDRNDDVLGFFHGWILELAEHVEKIVVICLEQGEFDLPNNVSVYSLGKESGVSRFKIIKNLFVFIWKKRKEYDKVFVHMNPIYIVLAGWLWKGVLQKDIFLWYTHKSVDWKLRIAEKFSKKIFTASKESFRLESVKLVVTGHGINTDLFKPDYSKKKLDELTLLSVGRISETKGLDVCIGALKIINETQISVKLIIIGSPVTKKDNLYQEDLQKLIQQNGLGEKVQFIGPIPNSESVLYFQSADIFVHASETGSLDKVILESMACGTLVVSSNDSVVPIVSKFDSHFVFEKNNTKDLADKLIYFYKMNRDDHLLGEKIREEVVKSHNLKNLILYLYKEIL